MKTGCSPVVALLVVAAVALTGCGVHDTDGDGNVDCTPPLACGPMYPVVYYPYMHNPYFGYLTPMGPYVHVDLSSGNQRRVNYNPRVAPRTSGWGTTKPLFVPKPVPPAAPNQAAKPAAPKPAPAAPKVSAPKVATRK